jgi:ribonuclease HI
MELTAATEDLRALRAAYRVRLVTDSQYVKKGNVLL